MIPYTIQALRTELSADPLSLGYNDNNDATLSLINLPRPSITKPRLIPRADVLKWAAKNGVLLPLKSASETAGPIQGIAYAALIMLQGSVDSFDFSDADNIAMVDALVSANVLTGDQRASLQTLATAPASRAEQIFGRNITIQEIEQARI